MAEYIGSLHCLKTQELTLCVLVLLSGLSLMSTLGKGGRGRGRGKGGRGMMRGGKGRGRGRGRCDMGHDDDNGDMDNGVRL